MAPGLVNGGRGGISGCCLLLGKRCLPPSSSKSKSTQRQDYQRGQAANSLMMKHQWLCCEARQRCLHNCTSSRASMASQAETDSNTYQSRTVPLPPDSLTDFGDPTCQSVIISFWENCKTRTPAAQCFAKPGPRNVAATVGVPYVLYIRPLGAVYGWIRLARTSPSRRRGRVRAGRIRPYTATRGLI